MQLARSISGHAGQTQSPHLNRIRPTPMTPPPPTPQFDGRSSSMRAGEFQYDARCEAGANKYTSAMQPALVWADRRESGWPRAWARPTDVQTQPIQNNNKLEKFSYHPRIPGHH